MMSRRQEFLIHFLETLELRVPAKKKVSVIRTVVIPRESDQETNEGDRVTHYYRLEY